jgi:hypothetical protein
LLAKKRKFPSGRSKTQEKRGSLYIPLKIGFIPRKMQNRAPPIPEDRKNKPRIDPPPALKDWEGRSGPPDGTCLTAVEKARNRTFVVTDFMDLVHENLCNAWLDGHRGIVDNANSFARAGIGRLRCRISGR